MKFFALSLLLICLFLFLIKGSLMVLRPESHFFLDRWLRGDKTASQEFINPKRLNLQWRIAGLIFTVLALVIGKVILTSMISIIWGR